MTLTNFKRLCPFVIAIIFLAGCAGNAHIEKDPSANLGNYKTFSWIEDGKNDAKTRSHKNDLVEANIRNAVNQELQKNGFSETKKNPDLLLTYDVLVERSTKESNNPVYTNPYSRVIYNPYTRRYATIYYPSRFAGYERDERTIKEGTVTISMIDTRTDKTVWQGWTTDEVNSRNLTTKEIQNSVKSIFKKFDVAKN